MIVATEPSLVIPSCRLLLSCEYAMVEDLTHVLGLHIVG